MSDCLLDEVRKAIGDVEFHGNRDFWNEQIHASRAAVLAALKELKERRTAPIRNVGGWLKQCYQRHFQALR